MRGRQSLQPSEDIKNNDLVWILYRKQPWPAMVKRVYPKKITYNFLPAKNHPNVFSTALKNVKIFRETDKLPSGASEEQREAYEIATRLLMGLTDESDENGNFVGDAGGIVDDQDDEGEDKEDSDVEDDEKNNEPNAQNGIDEEEKPTPKKSVRLSPHKQNHKKLQNADSVASTSSIQSASSKKLVRGASLNHKQSALKKQKSPVASSSLRTLPDIVTVPRKRGRPSKTAEPVISSTQKQTKSVTKKVTEYETTSEDDSNTEDDEKTSFTEDDDYVPLAKGASSLRRVSKRSTEEWKFDEPTRKLIGEKGDHSETLDANDKDGQGKINKSLNLEELVTESSCASYQPDDVVVVSTSNGMWPGKVIKVDDNELIYQLFPLDKFGDQAKIDFDEVVPFPNDHVDNLIDDNESTLDLCNAFKGVKKYLEDRGKNAAKLSDKAVKDSAKIVDNSSTSKSPVSTSKVNGVNDSTTASMPAQASALDKKKSGASLRKDKRAVSSLQASVDNEALPTRSRKRRFIIDEPADEESGTELSTISAQKSTNSSKDRQKILKAESANKSDENVANQKSSSSAASVLPKMKRARLDTNEATFASSTSSLVQKLPLNENSEGSPVTRKRLGLGRMAPNIKTKEVPPKKAAETTTGKKKEKPQLTFIANAKTKVQFLTVLLSDDTSAHLGKLWSNELTPILSSSINYQKPKFVNDLKIEFTTNGLISTVEDLEAAVNEIRKWIVLCTKLPKMSLLAEMHYIGNVALPEACVFALSQVESCTLKAAASKFQSLASEDGRNVEQIASSSVAKKKQAGKHALSNGINGGNALEMDEMDSSATTSLSTSLPADKQPQDASAAVQYHHQPFNDLVLAATIMQDQEKY